MKQTLYLTQFVILMILFVATTALTFETNLNAKEETGHDSTVQAIAKLACKGNKKCILSKLKSAGSCKLASAIDKAKLAVKHYKYALRKRSAKKQQAARAEFIKAVKPIADCSITPSNIKSAFKRGFKVVKSTIVQKSRARRAERSLRRKKMYQALKDLYRLC